MPIQLGRTRGEVYHTFCVLILKSPLTYALVQRRRVISCSPQFLRNLKTLNSLGAGMKSATIPAPKLAEDLLQYHNCHGQNALNLYLNQMSSQTDIVALMG